MHMLKVRFEYRYCNVDGWPYQAEFGPEPGRFPGGSMAAERGAAAWLTAPVAVPVTSTRLSRLDRGKGLPGWRQPFLDVERLLAPHLRRI